MTKDTINIFCSYVDDMGAGIAESVKRRTMYRTARVRFPAVQVFFLFSTASRPVLGPIRPPIQWVPGNLSLGVKRQGPEAVHSPPSSAEIRNDGAIPPLPHVFMA
jgi:hypothetical protein